MFNLLMFNVTTVPYFSHMFMFMQFFGRDRQLHRRAPATHPG